MTDSDGPSQNAEEPAPVDGPVPNPQEPPQSIPSFVHVLPCTNPPVKYLDRLDGCATGIHVTREDIQDLYVLYDKMADAIMGKDPEEEPAPVVEANPDKCVVCMVSIEPSPTSPVLYMENCPHYFHVDCLEGWRSWRSSRTTQFQVDCPHCRVFSSRALLWPQLFPTAATKNELFQLQKRSFGLHVAPQTILKVNKFYFHRNSPAFKIFVNQKHLTVRKRPPPPEATVNPQEAVQEETGEDDHSTIDHYWEPFRVMEFDLLHEIQQLHLAYRPRPFYLGDILPLEETPQYQAEYGCGPPLDAWSKRQELLLQFQCPFPRRNGPNGAQCSERGQCEFWHDWPSDTPQYIIEQIKLRQFPNFFCLKNSRALGPKCSERTQAPSQELVHCWAGFHPTVEDLQNVDAFAHKMAKLIMSRVVVPRPEPHLVCAFCHKTAEPNSAWMHMRNCVHWLHVQCLPLVLPNNPNRKLHCPTCRIPSVRTIAWPGLFPSDMAKQNIFTRQLAEFKLTVKADTQLAIVEVAIGSWPLANQMNIFTVDFGGPRVVIIDAATAQDRSIIEYD